jgi:hypothetical protein
MARALSFCQKQMYQQGDNYSEILDITDCTTLQLELRLFAISGATGVTGVLQHTSDPTYIDGSWSDKGTLGLAVTGVTGTTFSGLQRFGRVKLQVQGASGYATACVNAVLREA